MERPHHLLAGGIVPSGVLLLLELSQTCTRVELPVLVQRTVPLGVGEVARGFADGAGEGPEYRAGHQTGGVLDQVAPVLGFCLPIGVAELAGIKRTPTHHRDWEQS